MEQAGITFLIITVWEGVIKLEAQDITIDIKIHRMATRLFSPKC